MKHMLPALMTSNSNNIFKNREKYMTILYLMTRDADSTAEKIINEQKKSAKITVIDLRQNKEYDKIVDLIVNTNKIISW